MEFEDDITIAAEKQQLWELISDPEALVQLVPGAKEVDRVSETTYTGVIERGLAGINVTLDGEVEMVDLDRAIPNARGEACHKHCWADYVGAPDWFAEYQ